ncbi:hypothetical protein ACIQF6_03990 [Kitasatospora sp. NPDC092948]|uniref:hypothetical protein n=1 Tax=Kitasatospora sp. NPDC092948 TaxID=3364088 RepID=UPI0038206B30
MITSRRFVNVLAAPLLVTALASCTSTSPAASPAPAASAPAVSPSASRSPSPSAAVSAAEAGEQLKKHRAAGPAGAEYSADNGVVDLAATVNVLLGSEAGADDKADMKGRLTRAGFVVGLRHSWTAPDGSAADTLLLRFSADAGAESMAGALAEGLKSSHPDTAFSNPGTRATGVVLNTPDDKGKACVVQVAPHGDAVVLMNYYTPATPDKKTAGLQFDNQLGALPTPGLPWQ